VICSESAASHFDPLVQAAKERAFSIEIYSSASQAEEEIRRAWPNVIVLDFSAGASKTDRDYERFDASKYERSRWVGM